jgi:predicted nucleic acid-binding protein
MKYYFDTNCIIYLIEQNPAWEQQILGRIQHIIVAGAMLLVSDLTRAECLIGPFKKNDRGLETRYRQFFNDPAVHVAPLSAEVCEYAARIRARSASIKLPDALHLAAAVVNQCNTFLTADLRLASVSEITVEVLKSNM